MIPGIRHRALEVYYYYYYYLTLVYIYKKNIKNKEIELVSELQLFKKFPFCAFYSCQ